MDIPPTNLPLPRLQLTKFQSPRIWSAKYSDFADPMVLCTEGKICSLLKVIYSIPEPLMDNFWNFWTVSSMGKCSSWELMISIKSPMVCLGRECSIKVDSSLVRPHLRYATASLSSGCALFSWPARVHINHPYKISSTHHYQYNLRWSPVFGEAPRPFG